MVNTKENPIWEYFEENKVDTKFANCKNCSRKLEKGSELTAKLTTPNLKLHLKTVHPDLHFQLIKKEISKTDLLYLPAKKDISKTDLNSQVVKKEKLKTGSGHKKVINSFLKTARGIRLEKGHSSYSFSPSSLQKISDRTLK